MKSEKTKKLVLENLRRVPIIEVACSKSGIARSTLYRWKDQDKKFKEELEKALAEGEELINDMSESQLIALIKEKNFSAIRFWLKHRNCKFREQLEINARIERQEELTPEQEKTVRRALSFSSVLNKTSNTCNDEGK